MQDKKSAMRPRRQSAQPLTKAEIKAAIQANDLASVGLRVVTFPSATQTPREAVADAGVRGDVDRIFNGHLLKESLRIRDFFGRTGLHYPPRQIWQWLAHVRGLDVTAVFRGDEVLAVTIGYLWRREDIYLTHVTAVHRDFQHGSGLGPLLRKVQIDAARVAASMFALDTEQSMRVMSMSANPDTHNPQGAVGAQTAMLQRLGFTSLNNPEYAEGFARALHAAKPELDLAGVLEQDVTPLMFVAWRDLPSYRKHHRRT